MPQGQADVNIDPDSSSESQQVEQSSAPESTTGTERSAESSTAAEVVKQPPKSALGAVKAAMEKSRGAAEDVAKAAESSTGSVETRATEKASDGEGGKDDDGAKAADDQKGKGKGEAANTRIRELVERTKTLEPAAQSWRQVEDFVKQSGMTQEDFTAGLEIMALVKSDPFKARERLMPILEELEQRTGAKLSEELLRDVDGGVISQEHAQKLMQESKRREAAEAKLEAREAAETKERTARESGEVVTQVTRKLDTWHSSWKATDPDYEAKAPYVADRFHRLLAERGGQLDSIDAGVQLMEQARTDVEKQLGALIAKKPVEKKPVTGGANIDTAPRPKSSLEAAQQALRSR